MDEKTSEPDVRLPIWLRPERGARGPRPSHSRTDIAVAAIRLADTDGIDAVSLRRVAAELGTGTTSLYRYIDGKDELFDLMVEHANGERHPPAPTGDWQSDIRAIATEQRAMSLRHPWLTALPSTRPVLGPNGLAWLEATYATLDTLDLDPDEALARVTTLLTFVRGHVRDELAEQQAALRSGMDMDAWMGAQDKYADMIFNSGRYPRLVRMMLDAQTPHAADRFERAFHYGLDLIVNGLANTR